MQVGAAIQVFSPMDEFTSIIDFLDQLLADTSVPRNVRAAISRAKDKLSANEPASSRAGGAIYALDEVSNDINLPMHARTMIWNILSELEGMKNAE